MRMVKEKHSIYIYEKMVHIDIELEDLADDKQETPLYGGFSAEEWKQILWIMFCFV